MNINENNVVSLNANRATVLNGPLKFKQSYSLYSILNCIILGKYYGLLNSKTDMKILLRSLYISAVFCTIILLILPSFSYLLKFLNFFAYYNYESIKLTSINLATGFWTSTGILFWNLRAKYSSQWKYCAELYNSIFVNQLKKGETSWEELTYKKLTLAIDLLTLDLSNHKSFSTVFNFALEDAIKMYNQDFPKKCISLEQVKSGQVKVERIKNALSYAQNKYELIICPPPSTNSQISQSG